MSNTTKPKSNDAPRGPTGLISSLVTDALSIPNELFSSINPPSAPTVTPTSFMPPIISDLIEPVLDMGEMFAQSSVHQINAAPIRNGELLLPAFNSAQNVVNLQDDVRYKSKAAPEHFLDREDSLSHKFYAHTAGIIKTLGLDDAFTVPQQMATFPMSPFQSNITAADGSTAYTLSPTEFLAYMHAMWHGSLRFRLQCIGPREMTVRLAVVQMYGQWPTGVVPYEDAIQYPTTYITFDSEKREQILENNHVGPYRWLLRPDLMEDDVPNKIQRSSLGTILIYQVAALSGINVPLTSTPYINVWFCGGSDFSVNRFSPCPNITVFSSPAEKEKKEAPIARSLISQMKGVFVSTAQSGVDASMANLPGSESEALPSSTAPDIINAGAVLESADPQTDPTTTPFTPEPPENVESIEISRLPGKFNVLQTIALDVGSTGTLTTWEHPLDFLRKYQPRLIAATGRYLRTDLRVRVTLTTGSFSGGMGILFWLPYGVNSDPSQLTLERICTLKHTQINISNNKPQDLFIPYAYFAEYFSIPDMPNKMPNYGRVGLFIQSFMKPTTNAKPTTLTVQYRFENMRPYVPLTIPNFMAGTYTSVAQSGKGKAAPISVNNMAGLNSSTTQAEMRDKKAVSTLAFKKLPPSLGSFADQFHRPSFYYGGEVDLTAGEKVLFRLPCINADDAYGVATEGNLFDLMRRWYAAFHGDTRYDIIVRGSADNNIGVSIGTMVGDPQISSTTSTYPSVTPAPYGTTDYWPSRVGGTPPAAGFVVTSELPLTTFMIPGKISVNVPYLAQTRYVQAANWDDSAPQNTILGGFLFFWNAGSTDQKIYVEIYRNPMPGARLGHFVGMPKFYFDHLRNPGLTPQTENYPTTHFTIPPT